MPLIPLMGGIGAALGAGAATTTAAIAVGTAATAAAVGGAAYYGISANQNRIAERKAAAAARGGSSLGNLSEEEAGVSASRRMFRQGLYFTSPTGLGTGGGSRGRSRLFGA